MDNQTTEHAVNAHSEALAELSDEELRASRRYDRLTFRQLTRMLRLRGGAFVRGMRRADLVRACVAREEGATTTPPNVVRLASHPLKGTYPLVAPILSDEELRACTDYSSLNTMQMRKLLAMRDVKVSIDNRFRATLLELCIRSGQATNERKALKTKSRSGKKRSKRGKYKPRATSDATKAMQNAFLFATQAVSDVMNKTISEGAPSPIESPAAPAPASSPTSSPQVIYSSMTNGGTIRPLTHPASPDLKPLFEETLRKTVQHARDVLADVLTSLDNAGAVTHAAGMGPATRVLVNVTERACHVAYHVAIQALSAIDDDLRVAHAKRGAP